MDLDLMIVTFGALIFSALGGVFMQRNFQGSPVEKEDNVIVFQPKDPMLWIKLWNGATIVCSVAAAILLYFRGESTSVNLGVTMLLVTLCICAWTDLSAGIIPNRVLGIAVLGRLALLGAEALAAPDRVLDVVITCGAAGIALLIAGLLCRLVSSGALGFGDVKLMVVMGMFLGMTYTWSAVFWSMVSIFVIALVLLLTKKAEKKSGVPFAPALLLGTVLGVLL